MAKLRIRNNYGVAPNELLNSAELSFKAKGLFTYIQSKPDGWDFSAERIAQQNKDGIDSVSAGLRELEALGYLTRNKTRTPQGFWETEYVLNISHSGKSTMVTIVDNTTLDNTTLDNPQIKKERVSKKDNSKKDNPLRKVSEGENTQGKPRKEELFSMDAEVDKYLTDKQTHIRIIGLFFRYKNYQFTNHEQFKSAMSENLRPARKLIGYSKKQLLTAFARTDSHAKDKDYEWNLATVGKRIANLINK